MPHEPSAARDRASGTLQTLSDGLAGAVERAARGVVAIHARPRIPSSGIVWRPGVVVAADHTIRREEDIAVTFDDGRRARATLAGRDPGSDIAVLRIDGDDAEPVERIDAATLRVGHLALAVGRPGAEGATASLGVISALGGPWRTWHGGQIDRFIRLDLAIYDGFSGGALVDGLGRVAGLNTSTLARGVPIAIPASTVDRVADQLLTTGRVSRGYLGLSMHQVRLPESFIRSLSPPQSVGGMVVSIDPDGPAARAGVMLGDVLVAFDGTALEDPSVITRLLGGDRVGTKSTVKLLRAGAPLELAVTVGERPRRGG